MRGTQLGVGVVGILAAGAQPRGVRGRDLGFSVDGDEWGVSDVLGSILLVGITVVMAVGFGGILLAYDGPRDVQYTQLALTISPGSDLDWGTDDAELQVSHLGGEALSARATTVLLTDPDGALQVIEPDFSDGSLTIGETWSVVITALPGNVFEARIIVEGGGGSQLLVDVRLEAGAGSVVAYVASHTTSLGTATDFDSAKAAGDALSARFEEGALNGSSATTSFEGTISGGTATDPNLALQSDDGRAIMDAVAETIEVSGFPVGAPSVVSQVTMSVEGLASPGVSTVTLADQATGTAGSGTTVGTTIAAPVTGQTYLAIVAHGDDTNPNTPVAGVNGLGLAWSLQESVTSGSAGSGRGRMELWLGAGTPASPGTVSATFGASIEDAIIWVTAWSGVDPSLPLLDVASSASPSGSSSWSTGALNGDPGGRLAAFVNGVSANSVNFASPFTEAAPEVDKDAVHLAFAQAPATATETPSGALGSSTRWQAIAVALRPLSTALPTFTLRYSVAGGPAGATTLSPAASATEATFTADITTDRAWSAADLQALQLTVEATSLAAGASIRIDRVFITVTTSDSASYSLNAQLEWPVPGIVPTTGTTSLQIRYRTDVDTFTIEVLTAPSMWRQCGSLASSTFAVHTCTLTPAETATGSPVLRIRDDDPLGSLRGTLHVDYARIVTI